MRTGRLDGHRVRDVGCERVRDEMRHVAWDGVREGVDAAGQRGNRGLDSCKTRRAQRAKTHMAPTPRMALCILVSSPA